jgi:O-antigen/teichoic acid export membrane protein
LVKIGIAFPAAERLLRVGYAEKARNMSDVDIKLPQPASPEPQKPSLTLMASWLVIGKVISFVLSLTLPLLLVRRLSTEELGLYKQAFLVVGSATLTLPLGVGMSAYYFLPREPKRGGQLMLNILLFHAFTGTLALSALLFAPVLLRVIFNSSGLQQYAPLIGIVILLWGVAYFLETAVVANQESRIAAALIIVAQLSKTAFMVTAAILAASVRSLLYAALFQGIVQSALLIWYLNWRFPGFWRSFDGGLLRRQLSYAIPFGLAGLLYTLEDDYHNYFVSNRFGPVNFAVYSIGCLDIPLIAILIEAVGSVMVPRASALQREDNRRELIRLTVRAMRKLALTFLPVYAFLMVAGRDFIVALFTPQYADSWPIFAINLTMLPFATVMIDPLVRAYADQRYYLLRFHIVLFASMVGALWFGVQRFGMLGAVGVMVGFNIVGRLWMAIHMGRIIGVVRQDWKLLGGFAMVAIAAAAAAAVTAAVRQFLPPMKPLLTVVVSGLCYSAAYLAAVVLLKIPDAEERHLVRRFVERFAPVFSITGSL